eukprot:6868358-Pyramimonas_sp.AAC.1
MTFCGLHGMLLERVWLGLPCFHPHGVSALGTWSWFLEQLWVLRACRGRPTGVPGRSFLAQLSGK